MFTLSLSICLAVQGRAHSRPEWGPNRVCQEGMCAHLLWDQGQDAFALDTEMTVVMLRPRMTVMGLRPLIFPDLDVTD